MMSVIRYTDGLDAGFLTGTMHMIIIHQGLVVDCIRKTTY